MFSIQLYKKKLNGMQILATKFIKFYKRIQKLREIRILQNSPMPSYSNMAEQRIFLTQYDALF